jgi:hypothetical protein
MSGKKISPKAGCPEKIFGWIPGAVVAVKCGLAEIEKAIKSVSVFREHPEMLEGFELLEQVNSGAWTLATCGIFNETAVELSRILKMEAVKLVYDDCSGTIQYEIYDHGKSVENFNICEIFPGVENEADDNAATTKGRRKLKNLCQLSVKVGSYQVTFESLLIKSTEKAIAQEKKFIDQRFKELGICLPSKLPKF